MFEIAYLYIFIFKYTIFVKNISFLSLDLSIILIYNKEYKTAWKNIFENLN